MTRTFERRRRPLFRRRLKPSYWRRQWQRLSQVQQKRIESMSWAVSLHFLLVAVLAAIGLASPKLVTIKLIGTFASSSSIDSFRLLPPLESEDLQLDELEVFDRTQPPLEETLKELLEIDTDIAASVEAMPEFGQSDAAATLNQVDLPSAFSNLQTDSERITETNRRVAAAGGQLEGPVRFSLIFTGDDDLDLHVRYQEIGRAAALRSRSLGFATGFATSHIFFGNPRSQHAALDVDANARSVVPEPCENIIFLSAPRIANYSVGVHHYMARGVIEPTPYIVVVKYGNRSKVFEGTILPTDGMKMIWQFKYSQ